MPPGGRAYVFRQDGFTFDAGPTIITAPYLLEELWQVAGKRLADDVDLRPVDPFYKIRFDDGETLSCHADLDAMRAEVARISPEDAEGFDRFIRDSEKIYDIAFTQLVDQPFHKLGTLLKSVPDLVRLQGYRTVYRKVSDYFRHPKLRVAFSFHPLLIGGNPLTTTAYYCLIAHLERTHRVHYAMGGMGALVQGLVGLIEGLGGTMRYEAEVARIEVANGRATGVTLASGETIGADIVVSNADVGWTYSKLLGHHQAQALDRCEGRARALLDEPLRLVFRHQQALRFGLPPHHGARPALRGAAEATSSRTRRCRRISASISTAPA